MKIKHLVSLVYLYLGCSYVKSEIDLSTQFYCNSLESNSAALRLKGYLFCEYDQSIRPTARYQNATSVYFGLTPKFINVDDFTDTVTVHTLALLLWKDAHLTWEPSSYENIEEFKVNSYEIWVPDIVVHNAADAEGSVEMPYTRCSLSYTGDVLCIPTTVYTTRCVADRTWWPYDAMNCTIQFGSWSHSTNEIDFRFMSEEFVMDEFTKNSGWDVALLYTQKRDEYFKFDEESDAKMLFFCMILKRHAGIYSSVYLALAIVLCVTTLVTLWLEPKSTERMVVANVNFILHLICVIEIHWAVPDNGDSIPKLILFYKNSLILTLFSLLLTNILRHLQELTVTPPVWISSAATSIVQSKTGRIFLLSILDPKVSARIEVNADDNDELVNGNRKETTWKYIAILIGWVAFLVAFIVYIVLLAMYIPTSASGNSYLLNS